MIRGIIYDMDGVLVDACEWHYLSLNRALREAVGYEIGRADHVARFNGLPTRKKLIMLRDSGIICEDQFEHIDSLKQHYTLECIAQGCSPDDTKIEMHRYAQSQGLRLGCVTNAIRQTSELAMRLTGQLEMMDVFLTNQDVAKPKPSPDGYLLAMNMLGLLPTETLIVEDSPKGVLAATNSGAHVRVVRGPEEVRVLNLRRWLMGDGSND